MNQSLSPAPKAARADRAAPLSTPDLDINTLYFAELDAVLRAMVGPATLLAAFGAALLPLASATASICARCGGL
jgi:hypothetical protein